MCWPFLQWCNSRPGPIYTVEQRLLLVQNMGLLENISAKHGSAGKYHGKFLSSRDECVENAWTQGHKIVTVATVEGKISSCFEGTWSGCKNTFLCFVYSGCTRWESWPTVNVVLWWGRVLVTWSGEFSEWSVLEYRKIQQLFTNSLLMTENLVFYARWAHVLSF
jgi:hypothetical protein